MAATNTFSVVDYCVFGGMLLLCLLIGIYHAVRGKQTSSEVLLGGGQMNLLPVAASIVVSYLSAILILGTPAELYMNGAQYWVVVLVSIFVLPATAHLFVPIIYNCRVTSAFEYLQLRFESRLLRMLCVTTYMLRTSLYMGIALYAPSLALNSTTPLSLETSIVGTALVATVYTALGGLKAVVWTDTLQAVIMASGMVAIVAQGAVNVGGFTNIFYICADHNHLQLFDFNVDPWQRHNFWNLIFGSMFLVAATYSIEQASIQRYRSLPSLRAAQMACIICAPGNFIIISLACMAGLAIFATYAECDPLKTGAISRKDQLVPYFVVDQMSHVTGLPGLFVACIMSGALSTISSGLNSLAAITWQDILHDISFFKDMSEAHQTWTVKFVSFLYGCLGMAVAFFCKELGGLLQTTIAIIGGLTGPTLGVFCLGIFAPFSNYKGAVSGFLISVALCMWALFGTFGSGKQVVPLPTSVAGCDTNVTSLKQMTSLDEFSIDATNNTPINLHNSPNFIEQYLYGLSYKLYTPLGTIFCFILGCAVSMVTGCNETEVRESLVNPTAYKLLRLCRRCLRNSPLATAGADRDDPRKTSDVPTKYDNPAFSDAELVDRSGELGREQRPDCELAANGLEKSSG